jgi:hypothetical protein
MQTNPQHRSSNILLKVFFNTGFIRDILRNIGITIIHSTKKSSVELSKNIGYYTITSIEKPTSPISKLGKVVLTSNMNFSALEKT